jgi:hypothetical protein
MHRPAAIHHHHHSSPQHSRVHTMYGACPPAAAADCAPLDLSCDSKSGHNSQPLNSSVRYCSESSVLIYESRTVKTTSCDQASNRRVLDSGAAAVLRLPRHCRRRAAVGGRTKRAEKQTEISPIFVDALLGNLLLSMQVSPEESVDPLPYGVFTEALNPWPKESTTGSVLKTIVMMSCSANCPRASS